MKTNVKYRSIVEDSCLGQWRNLSDLELKKAAKIEPNWRTPSMKLNLHRNFLWNSWKYYKSVVAFGYGELAWSRTVGHLQRNYTEAKNFGYETHGKNIDRLWPLVMAKLSKCRPSSTPEWNLDQYLSWRLAKLIRLTYSWQTRLRTF